MSSIGERLREERERLGFNQTAFGAIGGVQKQAQLKYEKGERQPDAGYLEAVARVSADIQYIVTGERCPGSLTPDENDLLTHFREAPLAVKAAMLAAGKAGVSTAQNVATVRKGVSQQFNGPVGSVTSGDVVNQRKSKE
ncbi:transcriptional regulator [Ectopseudomonas toyotomiensis]|uniref:Transcriptional regulator, contains XRE-family HTH domain n=1 Tax=Ectopseudomonas toyotomiensis TaxID=554344 RepID=A0A1I5Z539_9GAMM|nr:helix-turn-helix domain-containing protein [Pseudomonas toyotomiensis]PIA65992.1 transcriptional regulator [Pseudomonas toyotomiensis]SFQ51594.1 Transcriptional regulator, contains XRE-family HTH domain [Pseudomonas toyotomiensis]